MAVSGPHRFWGRKPIFRNHCFISVSGVHRFGKKTDFRKSCPFVHNSVCSPIFGGFVRNFG